MPVGSIINQPAANSLNAAYRPIVLRVTATKTGGTSIPPVVFCDVYIDSIFYKTFSSTQYAKLNISNSEWEFDIQDACQEVLGKKLGINGNSDIIEAIPVISPVFCKFRSSGIDSNGFLQIEGIAPIQGTIGVDPVSGTGTQSNTFYIINATLQHEDNQDLASHLSSYRQRIWDSNSYPLTHRPETYKICKDQSDYFPLISEKQPGSLVLHYREKNSSSFLELTKNFPCGLALGFTSSEALVDGVVGNPYYFAIGLEGSLPIVLSAITKPSWMTIAVNSAGTLLEFTGTPDATGTNIPVSLAVSNCCGVVTLIINEEIDITGCTAASFATSTSLPDVNVDEPYNFNITLAGSAPFSLSNVVKPSWMSIVIVSNQIQITGTPHAADIANGVVVSFDVVNCGGTISVSDAIDVLGGYACGSTINHVFAGEEYDAGILYPLNITPGTTKIKLLFTNYDTRPNRIAVFEDSFIITYSNWIGSAEYAGPWGSNLNTFLEGEVEFNVVPGKSYKVRVETGNANPLTPFIDSLNITIQCI